MKILIITGHFPPMRGGMADYSARLCEELSRRRHNVRVITDNMARSAECGAGYELENLGGPWTLGSLKKLREKANRDRPDVVLLLYTPTAFSARGAGLPAALLFWAARRSLRIPFFVYGHELYAAWSSSYLRAPRYAAQRAAIAILLAIGERFEVLTEARRLRLARLFPWWKGKLGMIPCPPTLDAEKIDPAWRVGKGIAEGTTLISTMGLDHPDKGTRLLASLADGLSAAGLNFRYVTIGGITVDHPGVESWGYVSARDAWNLIAASDLFVAPYDDGVSGRRSTAQNALANGTPMLTTFGENTDASIFPDDALAMVPAKDETALVDKAIQLLKDPAELARLRASGRELGERVFSWNAHVKQWERLFSIASGEYSSKSEGL